MFFWREPWVHSRLQFDQADAEKCADIVMNAGLYNGFLCAGLLWGFYGFDKSGHFRLFLLACVTIAGIFGMTLSWKTLLLQAAPGALAAVCFWISLRATATRS